MNLRDVLRDFGAEDSELDHLADCDVCGVESDWDDASIVRCPDNPVTIAEADERRRIDEAWALMDFFGVPRPQRSGIALATANAILAATANAILADYVTVMQAQLDAPPLLLARFRDA